MPTSGRKLTPRELAIMQVVWDRGDVTVRDVHEALSRERKVAYTTVMTLMNILTTKGHLVRHQAERAYTYRAARPRQQVVGRLVREFVDRVFDGAAQPLLVHLVRHEKLTPAERAELKRMIETLED